jgi:hypothetical protein
MIFIEIKGMLFTNQEIKLGQIQAKAEGSGKQALGEQRSECGVEICHELGSSDI